MMQGEDDPTKRFDAADATALELTAIQPGVDAATVVDVTADATTLDPVSVDATALDPAAAGVTALTSDTVASSIHEDTTVVIAPPSGEELERTQVAEHPFKGDAASDFGPGYRLRNRYTLIERVGRGGMGEVWKAIDTFSQKAHDRNPFVAIKVFHGDFRNHPDAYAAMQREASRSMQLAHPNIVTVHNFDLDERSGYTFIVMELLEGESLDQLIRAARRTGLDGKQAWPIIRGMSEGLAYAHRKGYVHSDFKPANVFLTRDGVPKVLDFGIASAVRQNDGGAQALADDSVVSGYTELYAAPEVLEKKAPDTADDVFALGLVAYELLTGRHAFEREPATIAREKHLKPAPVKGLKLRQWHALEKALALTREKRFSNASAFLRALPELSPLQTRLIAAVAVLALLASGLWYRGYLQGLPQQPLSALPVAEQQIVTTALADGRSALALVKEQRIMEASDDAAQAFATAYAHHPKNPDAVAGLEEAADIFIRWCRSLPDRQDALTKLRSFQQRSEFYLGYRPLRRAIEQFQEG